MLILNKVPRRARVVVTLTAAVLLLAFSQHGSYYFSTRTRQITGNDIINKVRRQYDDKYKTVQLLTNLYNNVFWIRSEGTQAFEECAEKRCYLFKRPEATSDYDQQPLEASDGVMVHLSNLYSSSFRRNYNRRRRQLWLLYTMEPPIRSWCSSHYAERDLDDWFNITNVYRPDNWPGKTMVHDYKPFRDTFSSLVTNVKYVDQFQQSFGGDLSEALESLSTKSMQQAKRQKAPGLWLVSHCTTFSHREDYVRELKKHMRIDIYGSCQGAHADPCGNHWTEYVHKKECFFDLYNSYRFYMAFENSRCDHYITEKLWKFFGVEELFRLNVVLVVRGAPKKHYEELLPPRSVIYADDFDSPQKLAGYLNELSQNESAYLEYFEWKRDLYRQFAETIARKVPLTEDKLDMLASTFCRMCGLLHNETYLSADNEVAKISGAWFGSGTCRNDNENWSYLFSAAFSVAQYFGYCFEFL